LQYVCDRFANFNGSYLIKRLESSGGSVFLTSNFSVKIDCPFIQAVFPTHHFPMPTPADRPHIPDQNL
jgi:hypothetical protein